MQLIGFRRNIYLEWLEETATLACMGEDAAAIRETMEKSLRPTIASAPNRRMAIDILVNIWFKSREAHPALHEMAGRLFQETMSQDDHVGLHYGMTLLTYPFFRQAAEVIGQMLRFGGAVRTATLQERIPTVLGSLGAVRDACKRVTFSLRNWGILVDGDKRYSYTVREPRLRLSGPEMECWLLAAALRAHPAESMPFEDLVHLPELFPFEIGLTARGMSECELLEVHRQGGGWDMVRLAH